MASTTRYFNRVNLAENFTTQNEQEAEQQQQQQDDDFEDREKIDIKKYKMYSRINKTSSSNPRINYKLENTQLKAANAVTRAAIFDSRSSATNAGITEPDEGETTLSVTQSQILAASSIATQKSHFELYLSENGPFVCRYSPGGKQVLMAGQMGQIANFSWRSKQLTCEVNVAERINDCCWLHNDTMFAVAQKRYTHVYDKKGTELHCIKRFDFMQHIDFLPYHLLLTGINDRNYLSYFDISVGKLVSSNKAYSSKSLCMAQNRSNGVALLGHTNGVVSLWSPSADRPLASILCHNASLSSIAVSDDGNLLATASKSKQLCLWDSRNYKCLQKVQLREFVEPASHLSFSQTKMLAVSSRDTITVFKADQELKYRPYLQHKTPGAIKSHEFCPFEDILGIGHSVGFASMIVPGAGIPNIDTNEANPIENKKQRRNKEVTRMMEKVNHEMIDLDHGAIGDVNVSTLREEIIRRNESGYLKKKSISVGNLKHKMRGKGKDSQVQSRSQAVFKQKLQEKLKDELYQESRKKDRKGVRGTKINNKHNDGASKKKSNDPLSVFEV